MARSELVENTYWDEMETEGFSLNATNVYLWSFTNQRCNMAGLYVVAEKHIYNGRLSIRKTREAVAELQAAGKLFYDAPLMWVKARVQRLPEHHNLAKAIAKDVSKVAADHWMRAAFLDVYGNRGWLKDHLADLALESQNVKTLRRVSQGSPNGVGGPSTTDAGASTGAGT